MFGHGPTNYLQAAQVGGAEFHAPLWVNGSFKRGNYIGPGTNLIDRLKRGDKPVSGADKVAQAHDLRYTLAKGNAQMERAADVKMLAKLKDPKLDNVVNRAVGYAPIRAKMALEDAGVFPKGYMSQGPSLTPEDKSLVETKLSDLELEGFGKPAARLRQIARQQGCGGLPPVPPNLPIQVPENEIQQIRQIALSLGVPGRIDEWVQKQNLYLYYKSVGVPDADAIQASFGTERPWDGLINKGVAAQVVSKEVAAEAVPQALLPTAVTAGLATAALPKKRRRPTMGKEEFLEKMRKGKMKAKRMKTGKPGRIPKKKRMAMAKQIGKVLKRRGRGLVLAGTGMEAFTIPDDMPQSGLPAHIGGYMKKNFNIEASPEMMASMGEILSGTGRDKWDALEEKLSGLVPVS